MLSNFTPDAFRRYAELAGEAYTNWYSIIRTIVAICPGYNRLTNEQLAEVVFSYFGLRDLCKKLVYRDEEFTSASRPVPELSLGMYITQCMLMLDTIERGEEYLMVDESYITPWLHPAFYWLRARVRELDLQSQNR